MRPPLLLCSLLLGIVAVRSALSGTAEDALDAATPLASDDRAQQPAGADTVLKRLGRLGQLLSDLVARRQDADGMLSGISSRLDDISEALTTLSRGQVLGAPCRGHADCAKLRADAVCSVDGRCACRQGLQEVAGGACRTRSHLSQTCRRDHDCHDDFGMCDNQVCKCAWGYVADDDKCRLPKLSERCVQSCGGEGTICRLGRVCVCGREYWNDNNVTCRPHPLLSEPCNTTAECRIRTNDTACVDNVCACAEGFTRTELEGAARCVSVARHNERCSTSDACRATSQRLVCDSEERVCKCAPFSDFGTGRLMRLNSSNCQTGFLEVKLGRGWFPYFTCRKATRADAGVLCRALNFTSGRPMKLGYLAGMHIMPEAFRDFRKGLVQQGFYGVEFTCSGSEETVSECDWSRHPKCEPPLSNPVKLKCLTRS